MSWAAIVFLALGAYGCKLFGVVVLGRVGAATTTTGPLAGMAGLLPAALFAALIAVQTFETEGALQLDARAAGVAVAAIAVWRKAPFVVVVALAMAVTALIRWQT